MHLIIIYVTLFSIISCQTKAIVDKSKNSTENNQTNLSDPKTEENLNSTIERLTSKPNTLQAHDKLLRFGR